MKNEQKRVAYIFEDSDGFYYCSDNLDCLDTRGESYKNITCAIRGASYDGYTHYKRGNSTRKISERDHELNWATG